MSGVATNSCEKASPISHANLARVPEKNNEIVSPTRSTQENQGESALSSETKIEFTEALEEYEGSDP